MRLYAGVRSGATPCGLPVCDGWRELFGDTEPLVLLWAGYARGLLPSAPS